MRLRRIRGWSIVLFVGLGTSVSLAGSKMTECEPMRGPVMVLGTAYQNAVLHDGRGGQLEPADLQLEDAAVQLTSLLAACGADRQSASADCACVPGEQDLQAMADSVSYAAQKLMRASRMESAEGAQQNSATAARMNAMAHLYRVVFALSKSVLDPSQGAIYLHVARQEIAKAQDAMRNEQQQCGCNAGWYESRVAQLSDVNERLSAAGIE
jgi:hypothetical protein